MKPKTKYIWDLMPQNQPRERGEFDKDRYVIKGNEIAQMEKNQQTDYNNMLRRLNEGLDNNRLEGMEDETEFKIAGWYQKIENDTGLANFIASTEAGFDLLKTGAGIYKNRQVELGREDRLNPENAKKYAELEALFKKKYEEYHVNGATFEQTLALIKKDTEISPLFEELIRGKSHPRAAALMEGLALKKGQAIPELQDWYYKNVATVTRNGKQYTYQELLAAGGGISANETNQLAAQAKVMAVRASSFIGSAGDRVTIPTGLVKNTIQPVAEKVNDTQAITNTAVKVNDYYNDLYRKQGPVIKDVVATAAVVGPESALFSWDISVKNYAAQAGITDLRVAEKEMFEMFEAVIRNEPGSDLAVKALAFLNSPVPESDKKDAPTVPLLTRKHAVLTETGLLQTAETAAKTITADQKSRAVDLGNAFLLNQNAIGVDEETLGKNISAWLKTPDGTFAATHNPDLVTNIRAGVFTSNEKDQNLVIQELINIATGQGGQISRQVAQRHGASNETIASLSTAGYIRKIEFPPNANLNESVNAAVMEISQGAGETFKNIEQTLIKHEVNKSFAAYWKHLTGSADFTDGGDAWKKAWELVHKDKQLILEAANRKANLTPIQTGHSATRYVLDEMARLNLSSADMSQYLTNHEIPQLLSEFNILIGQLEKNIRPGDFRELINNNDTLKVTAQRLGFPLHELVDLQLRKLGVEGGLPDWGENYVAQAKQVGPVLAKRIYSNKNQLKLSATTWTGDLQKLIESFGINPPNSMSADGPHGKDNRFVGSSLNQIFAATKKGEIPFSNNIGILSGDGGRANLIDALKNAGFERHQEIAPGLIGGYNLNAFHTRQLGALFKLNTIAGEEANILGSIFRSGNRRLQFKKEGNLSKNVEVEIKPDSPGYQWLAAQDPAVLRELGFELSSKKLGGKKGPGGYSLIYVGDTKPLDLSILGLANKVSFPHKTTYNEGVRAVLINQAFKQDPMSITYNGKTFFELDSSTQRKIMEAWRIGIQQTAGSNITPGLK